MVQMGMQKVPHHERLYKRGNTYQYRFLIPVELRAYFGGKSEIKKSLKTDSLKEAKVRWAAECEITDREIADARHKLAGRGDSHRMPTQSEAWAMNIQRALTKCFWMILPNTTKLQQPPQR